MRRPGLLLAAIAAVLALPLVAWAILATMVSGAEPSLPVASEVGAGGPAVSPVSGSLAPTEEAARISATPSATATPPPVVDDPLAAPSANGSPAVARGPQQEQPSAAASPPTRTTQGPTETASTAPRPPTPRPTTSPTKAPRATPAASATPTRPSRAARPERSRTRIQGSWTPPSIVAGPVPLAGPRLTSAKQPTVVVACSPAAGCRLDGGVLQVESGTRVTLTWRAPSTPTHTAWSRRVSGTAP